MSALTANEISNEQYADVRFEQNQTQSILDLELNRLVTKKENLDAESENKKRMIIYNETYRDRQRVYVWILFILLAMLLICFLVVLAQKKFGVQSVYLDLLIIVVVAVGLITTFILYRSLSYRDPIYFSKLNQDLISKPSATNVNQAYFEASQSGNITAMSNLKSDCVGAACCTGPGFQYDVSLNKCFKT